MRPSSSIRLLTLCVVSIFPSAALAKKAHKAHEHGLARLNVAVDDKNVMIELDVPAEGVFGFEHEAKTAADKAKVAADLEKLKAGAKAGKLFLFDAASGCELKDARAEAIHEEESGGKSGHSHADGRHGEHSEVEAEFEFTCAKSPAGTSLRLGLSKAFPRIRTVKVQALSGSTQSAATITNDKGEIKL